MQLSLLTSLYIFILQLKFAFSDDLNSSEVITLSDGKTQLIERGNKTFLQSETNGRIITIDLSNTIEGMNKGEKVDFTLRAQNPSGINSGTYPMSQWLPVLVSGEYPSPRKGHVGLYANDRFIIFGGCKLDIKCFNDIYVLRLSWKRWERIVVKGILPPPRGGASGFLMNGKLYIFGGGGMSGYFNDLFEFDFETNKWTQLLIVGTIPTPRSGHRMILTKKGRIVLFGGYTDYGYSNEVFFLDMENKRWEKPMLSGKPPSERESFGMVEVRNQLWIIGGYSLGKYNNDLIVLDLDQETWLWAQTTGPQPTGRQGLDMVQVGKRIVIFGGCNFRKDECYKDTYILHIDTLVYSVLDHLSAKQLTEREGLSLIGYGKLAVGFGGCRLIEKCFGDLFIFHVDLKCYEYCSSHGKCENEFCTCAPGFRLDDCSYSNQCGSNECFNQGVCGQRDKCECFPGYEGNECETLNPCKSNCTSPTNGVCRSGNCLCYEPFIGDDCNDDSRKKKCPKDCSGHGFCDTEIGLCTCEKGWINEDCGTEYVEKVEEDPFSYMGMAPPPPPPPTIKVENNDSNATNETATPQEETKVVEKKKVVAEQAIRNKISVTKPEEEPVRRRKKNSGSPVDEELDEDNDHKQRRLNITTHKVSGIATPAEREAVNYIYGQSIITDLKANKYTIDQILNGTEGSKPEFEWGSSPTLDFSKIENCPNFCSYRGICYEKECYCESGYVGRSCEASDMNEVDTGVIIFEVLIKGGITIFVSFILSVLVIWYMNKRSDEIEFMNIKMKNNG